VAGVTVSHDWNASYEGGEPPPWDIGRPQPALVELFDDGAVRGRVLDAGCGTGEHALLAAARGLSAIGVDIAAVAIDEARAKARSRELEVRFLVHSALELPALGEEFDTVIDCGLFHVFSDDERARYVAALGAVLASGGRYFMVCFSDLVPGTTGPRRIRQEEIRAAFGGPEWRVDEIVSAQLVIRIGPEAVPAWRAAVTRL
jgi:SAM-dependent methyltransferase